MNAIGAPTRLLIVEDHPILGEALGALLGRDGSFTVVEVSPTLAAARSAIARETVDLVISDQHLPDGKGTALARELRTGARRISVILLTGDPSEDTLLAAVESGVAGFIPKSEPAARIVDLVKRAAAGEIVIPFDDLVRLLERQRQRDGERRERERLARTLTPRDREVLDLMATGLDTKAIATATGLAVNTIRGHVQAIIEKLETHSRLEAVIKAGDLGIARQAPVTHLRT